MRKKRRFSHLTLYEREQIFVYKRQGKSVTEIGRLLDRHHTTISRELDRNSQPTEMMRAYLGKYAHIQAKERKSDAGKRLRLKDHRIREYVQQQMKIGWTPEIIAHYVQKQFKGLSISHEAIYQYIYHDWPEGIEYLPRKHARRLGRGYKNSRNRCPIPNRTDISKRPKSINERKVFGHWESDSLESDQSKVIINVIKERKSRLVKITRLETKKAELTKQAIVESLQTLPTKARQSITYDNGAENYYHEQTNELLKTKSYFCQPYHSWEKGAVEQINGLIRRFIPKKTDLSKYSQEHLDQIENLLNHRPRKCLGYKTPTEVFLKFCGALPP
jgi:transposase, IS30 family